MYAIVEIAGQQFKVAKDQKVYVHRLAAGEGDQVSFDQVLLLADGEKVTIGAPAINGAQVEAKVLKHLQGDKVIVFKKKRRKGYKVKNGHRQQLSHIVIENIIASGSKKKATPKKEEVKEEAPKKAETKENVVAKAVPKKTTSKKDDLKKIEGIGPKIAETLATAGIVSFSDLAVSNSENIAEIIAGVRGNHNPTTWPEQAQLAADGKWDELKVLQDKLDGGVKK